MPEDNGGVTKNAGGDDTSPGAGTQGTGEQAPPDNAGQDTPGTQAPPEKSSPAVDPKVLQTALEEQRKIQAGLDRANAQLQAQLKDASDRAAELEVQLGAYRAATDGNEGEVGSLQAQIEISRKELEKREAAIKELQQQNERMRIVMSDFQELAPLAAVDALPRTQDEAEFREAMTRIAESLKRSPTPVGEKPPASPGTPGPKTLEQLAKEMDTAFAAGDEAAYQEAKSAYQGLVDQNYEKPPWL